MADPRHELADSRSGDLGAHDVHGVFPAHGQHRHQEDQHAHAADPVGEHAPEHHAARHAVKVGKHRGAGRREAGHGLKQGVDVVRHAAREHKRHRPDQGNQDPAQPDDDKAVAGDEAVLFRLRQKQQQSSGHRRRGHGHQKWRRRFPKAEPRDERQEKQRRVNQENEAKNPADHAIVHRALSRISSRLRSRPAAVTTMAWSPGMMTVLPFGRMVLEPRIRALIRMFSRRRSSRSGT